MKTNSVSVEELVMNNNRLILSIINKKFEYHEASMKEELYSEGLIALFDAANNFDESKGFKFCTFAYRCISNRLLVFIKKEMSRIQTYSIDEPDQYGVPVSSSVPDCSVDIERDSMIKESVDMIVRFLKEKNERGLEMMIMKSEGYSDRDIAKKYNISNVRVGQIILEVRDVVKKNFKECEMF